MNDDDDLPERSCVDCRRSSPAQASEYTLISTRYGWRLTKETAPDGRAVLEWRCPECFAKHRGKAKAAR
ncbi:MAG TPA: hypothetical protein VM686_21325 [Polyangiaceae bacterium]|nr:hypothetical protein [Polyangiaceae bacterium]